MAAYTTIDNPELYFQADLYTGNGSNNHAQTFDGDENMQPNMVWIKSRSAAENHHIFDSVRGANVRLMPNATNVDFDDSSNLQSFDSNGYTLGTADGINKSSATFVCWGWKESTTAGFDIVSYTGTGSNQTIAHGLGTALDFIIVKNRATTNQWCIYNRPRSAEKFIHFDATDAESDASTPWQDTEPTSSVFSVGASNLTNGDGNGMIAYCFASIQGFSKFGSYVGNANANGPFIHTGFRPAFFLYKTVDTGTEEWKILDNKRDTFNRGSQRNLVVNHTTTESDDTNSIGEFLSNGVKIRSSHNNINKSGDNYIYMAFAESPFVNSNGVPNNAR
jgi:hypothetical protein